MTKPKLKVTALNNNEDTAAASQNDLLLEILERVKSIHSSLDVLGESSVRIEAGIHDCRQQVSEVVRDHTGLTRNQIHELQVWLDQVLKKPVKPSLWSRTKAWYTDKLAQLRAWREARRVQKLMRQAAELQELLRQAEAK